jgi:hypothetical protein
MSGFDISGLNITQEAPNDYWDQYDVPTAKTAPPILKGEYIFKVPEVGDDFKAGNTKEGFFCFELNPTVTAGPSGIGRKLLYVRRSVKKYTNRQGSQAGDLIKACELDYTPRTNQEWAQIGPMLAGREFGAVVDLRVYDKAQNKEIFKKQDDLYKRADGTPKLRYVILPDNVIIHKPGDADEEKRLEDEALKPENGGREVWANANIVKMVPVSEIRARLEKIQAAQ